jgi:LmbE family N-acetylglucosaminyl deacetylase
VSTDRRVAFAIAAHPDDIEFQMAGTLVLLKQAGYQLHYMNIANGSCGTATRTRAEIVRIRTNEAKAACKVIGATFHPPLVNDLDIFYEEELLARVSAVVRKVRPTIMLVPSPQDYMEDHVNAGRLAVSAAFFRGMRNYPTIPRTKAADYDVTLYHSMPHGLRDSMRRRILPEYYVDISSVLALKREMLSQHRSQKEWLDVSQGFDSYLKTMEEMAAELGRMSGRFKQAEGWRRHSHIGFSDKEQDPLLEALGKRVKVEQAYRRWLEQPVVRAPRRRKG